MALELPGEERRANTMAVSRSAAQMGASVVAGLFVAGAIALFNSSHELSRAIDDIRDLEEDYEELKARIHDLEDFGPGTGKRFTFDDWKDGRKELKQEIRDNDQESIRRHNEQQAAFQALNESVSIHHEIGAHADADRRMSLIERRLDRLDGGD